MTEENITEEFVSSSIEEHKVIFMTIIVIFAVYGLLYMMNSYWILSLALSLLAGWMFWYLCTKYMKK